VSKSEDSSSITSDEPQRKIIHQLRNKQKMLYKDEIEQIIAGYKDGLEIEELARRFNCHRITIWRQLKKASLTDQ